MSQTTSEYSMEAYMMLFFVYYPWSEEKKTQLNNKI